MISPVRKDAKAVSTCWKVLTRFMPLLEVTELKVHFPVGQGMFSRERESVKAVEGAFTAFSDRR